LEPEVAIDPGAAGPGFVEDLPIEDAAPLGSDELTSTPIWQRINLRYLLVPLAAGAYVAAMLGYRALRRHRRRQRSTSPDQIVTTAWTEAVEAVELGFDRRRAPAETRTEFAGRLIDLDTPGGPTLRQLAELSTQARFHPHSVTSEQSRRADELADQINSKVNESVPIQTRLLRQLDPRRLFTPSPGSGRRVADDGFLRRRLASSPLGTMSGGNGARGDDEDLVDLSS
ncbi:MAG: DUF4129 domain-containing protein, partial [Acidimicrobiia bacterium]|nr:DUF4129 domain-containing protein [Acidimicrobiia bacterium]